MCPEEKTVAHRMFGQCIENVETPTWLVNFICLNLLANYLHHHHFFNASTLKSLSSSSQVENGS